MRWPKRRDFKMLAILLGILTLAGWVAGCSGGAAGATDGPKLAPLSEMPQKVQQAPLVVREAYQFAVANPDIMQEVECYCGCGAMGHTSNYNCYVRSVDDAGNVTFDGHALGCTLCVDITQDTMRLTGQGKSPAAIQAYVDHRYSQYGPPTP